MRDILSTTQRGLWIGLLIGLWLLSGCGKTNLGPAMDGGEEEPEQPPVEEETYELGGEIEGITAGSVMLRNATDDQELSLDEDGPFAFEEPLEDGSEYDVGVSDVVEGWTCSVSNGQGEIDGADVGDIGVVCQESSVGPEPFEIAIDAEASDLEIDPGETAAVVVDVSNVGVMENEEMVEFSVNDEEIDRTELLLGSGESEELEFMWSPGDQSPGEYEVRVSGEENEAQATIVVWAVEPPILEAEFEISIDEGESILEGDVGDDLLVVADVINVGGEEAEQTLAMTIDGVVVDEVELALDGGADQMIGFMWTPTAQDVGTTVAEVSSDDDTDSVELEVFEPPAPPFFEVAVDEGSSNLEVEAGEIAQVAVEVSNTGDETGTQDVVLEIGGQEVDTWSDVEVNPGGETAITLSYETTAQDVGTLDAEVISEDDSATTQIEVLEPVLDPPFYLVEIDEDASDGSVDVGETAQIAVEVSNTGETTGSQDIWLSIEGDMVNEEEALEVAPDGSETVVLSWTASASDVGTVEAIVSSEDSSDTWMIDVDDVPDDGDGSLVGEVEDLESGDGLEGVDVVLLDGSGAEVARETSDSDGAFSFGTIDAGSYDMSLEAPGLHPDYGIVESGLSTTKGINIGDGEQTSATLTLDWRRQTDVIVDGGLIEFAGPDVETDFTIPLPRCAQQTDGQWVPVSLEPGGTVEVDFSPSNECFRIDGVDVDIATGEMEADVDDVLFPDMTVITDEVDSINEFADEMELFLEWIFEGVSGEVDYVEGSQEIALDTRIRIGGSVVVGFSDFEFGSYDGFDDCQLTKAWGGDVSDPDVSGGAVNHDAMEIVLTTGESGPDGETGVGFDEDTGLVTVIDNQVEVGRISEGPLGGDDPGGAACGDIEIGWLGVEEDYAEALNGFLGLPSVPGTVFFDLDMLSIE